MDVKQVLALEVPGTKTACDRRSTVGGKKSSRKRGDAAAIPENTSPIHKLPKVILVKHNGIRVVNAPEPQSGGRNKQQHKVHNVIFRQRQQRGLFQPTFIV
jgi:hypothetical protein